MIDTAERMEVTTLRTLLADIRGKLGIDSLREEQEQLSKEQEDPALWSNQERSKRIGKKLAAVEQVLQSYDEVLFLSEELSSLEELLKDSSDVVLEQEYRSIRERFQTSLRSLETRTFLAGMYDDHDAVVSIHAGQGGDEANDWANMVLRMYLRYFERKNWKTEYVEESRSEAGLKSATLIVHGAYAYGLLRNEAGAHRLVRLSPFNADNLRQTSFVGVEVLPLIEEDDATVELNPDDLEWAFTRAGGHGGQNVNKVNSAVILTHRPSGIVVECRQERYQEQNKKTALSILKSKLAKIEEEKRRSELAAVKGEYKIAGWGNQIRNYVLHPYHLVKDTRTKIETSDTDSVLDGDLDLFTQSAIRLL